MPLPIYRLPGVLPHVEWILLALYQPAMGVSDQDPGRTPQSLPRCERCGIQVPSGRLNTHHYASEKFNQGEERHIRRETLQHCFEASKVSFQINAETLPPLEAFTYLGCTIAYNNRNWASVYQNLHKAWKMWEMLARVLEKTRERVRA